MSTSRQFWKFHFDYLQNPEFVRFMQHPSHLTFTMILSHVYRGPLNRPSKHELYPFFKEGWLVARPSLLELSQMYPPDLPRAESSIRRDILALEAMGLIDTYEWNPGSNESKLLQVGSWSMYQHPGRGQREQYIEVLYVDRIFGPQSDEEGGFFG